MPGLILLSIRRRPYVWECDPWSVWNCLGLGHWTEFAWPVLLAEIERRSAA